MFNLGFSEIIVLGVIALIFIGPKQLPDVARAVGKLLNEWKRATSELTSSFTENEAFRDWEERRQKYLSESKEPEKPIVEPVTETQLEMKIEDDRSRGGDHES